jgi:tRNA pseudouridine38-40 synthase
MEIRYRVSLTDRRLDLEAMQLAADSLIGEHDFTSFGASLSSPCEDDPVKTLWLLDARRFGKRLEIVVEGSGFLYKMVRSLCGALFEVGRGKLQVPEIRQILERRERTSQVITAPPHGLCLEKVLYRKPRK